MSSRAALADLNTLNQEALKALILAQQEEILSQREQLQAQKSVRRGSNPLST